MNGILFIVQLLEPRVSSSQHFYNLVQETQRQQVVLLQQEKKCQGMRNCQIRLMYNLKFGCGQDCK